MLDVVTEPIKKAVKKRLDTTFYASYLIALAAINWRAVFFLFFPDGDVGAEERLDWIDRELYPFVWSDRILKLIIAPLLFAGFATTLFPWAVSWMDKFRYGAIVDQKNRRKEEESKLQPVQKKIMELTQQLAEKEKEAEDFKQKNILLTKSLTNEKEKVKEAHEKLQEVEAARLRLFKEVLKNDPLAIAVLRKVQAGNGTYDDLETLGVVEAGFVKHHNGKLVLTKGGESALDEVERRSPSKQMP